MAERKSGRGFWGAFRHAFAVPAQERLTPWEHECLCKLAHKVVERGLTAPAILMLESARPLNYLGAHAILFFKPIISLVFAPGLCERVAALLQKRRALGALIETIQQCNAEREANVRSPGTRP